MFQAFDTGVVRQHAHVAKQNGIIANWLAIRAIALATTKRGT